MSDTGPNRCEYVWPPDHKLDDHPNHQSCCWRQTLPDTGRCAWHADPESTDEKTIVSLQEARQDPDVRNRTGFELLDGAILPGFDIGNSIPLSDVGLRKADLTNADLQHADLTDANLEDADLSDADLLGADLTDAFLKGADLTDTDLRADLTDANLLDADLTDADLRLVEPTDVYLVDADLTDADLRLANLTDADLRLANLTDANLEDADLTDANLEDADLTDANLEDADLTDANLGGVNLTDANLEGAKSIGANLFDATLTRITPYGARFTGAQINDGTEFHADKSEYARWWQRGPLSPPPRCGYEPAICEDEEEVDKDVLLTRAADTYRQFEELARDNTRPVLQSSMFVLRQDMLRKRYRLRRDPFRYVFAVISGGLFRYGESLARIFAWGLLFMFAYAAAYDQFNLIVTESGSSVNSFVDVLYFSTLTFTTLGLGDFKPDPMMQSARLLVTSQAVLGAILIAIFVFVLGRRAAR